MWIAKGVISIALLIKTGAAPLHGWYAHILEKIEWVSILLLATIQKIIPLMLATLVLRSASLFIFIIFSLLMSRVMILAQASIKHLLIYSRIYNVPWLLIAAYSANTFLFFFFFYSIGFSSIISWALWYGPKKSSQIKPLSLKLVFIAIMANLAGLPPFVGFWAKLAVIKIIVDYSWALFIIGVIV